MSKLVVVDNSVGLITQLSLDEVMAMNLWLIDSGSDTITIEQSGGSGIGTSTSIIDGDNRKDITDYKYW